MFGGLGGGGRGAGGHDMRRSGLGGLFQRGEYMGAKLVGVRRGGVRKCLTDERGGSAGL